MFFKKAKKYAAGCSDERRVLNTRLDDTAKKLDDVLERLRKGADHIVEKRRHVKAVK